MDHVWYEQLPDGMHDVLVGPQGGLFLAGFDSLRRVCLVLYAPPFGQPCVAQYADMARNTWLALAKHLRNLADGKLHRAEQAHDTQARRVGESAEDQFGSHCSNGYKDIFISVNHLPR